MTAHYEKVLPILADAFKQQYAKFARKQTDSQVVKASRKIDTGDYVVGVAVPYQDPKDQSDGQFHIGLTAGKKAVQLASAIAAHTGLKSVSELNDTTVDILNNFITTVVKHTAAEWSRLGRPTEFGPSSPLASQKMTTALYTTRETHIVTLSVSGESVAIFVNFAEIVENVLLGKKVLIVDDSRMIRMILTRAFKKQGCRVIEAEDGNSAVEKFQQGRPDLTVMDMVMPHMNGLEAIGKIREMAPLAKVLVLTAAAGKNEVIAAASLGIRGYVKKPVKPEKLIETAAGCFN